ncbi:hypothetical protein LTR09_004390 [Extremus antarcticus]|uniref:Uncharacterized protein n=1 Tax=Extremus antarcticus TaxID=702011 RepID=A0AAJ0GD01_9PEZI|nr:hypothetical protein LTR09_004390 [Extremus antarcticus]
MTADTLYMMSAISLNFSATTTAQNTATFTNNQTTLHIHNLLTSAPTHLNPTLALTSALSLILLLLVLALSFSYRTLSRLPFFPRYVQPITIFHALATEAVQLLLALTAIVAVTSILNSGIPSLRSPERKIREAWALEAAACLCVVVFWCAVVDAVDWIEGRVLLGRWGRPYDGHCLVVTQCTHFGLEQGWRGRQQVRGRGSTVRERRARPRQKVGRGRGVGRGAVELVAEPTNSNQSEIDGSSAEATNRSRTPSSVSPTTPSKGMLLPTPPESSAAASPTTTNSGSAPSVPDDLEHNAATASLPSPPDSAETNTFRSRTITKEQHRHFRVIDTEFYCKDTDAGSPTKSSSPRSQSAPSKSQRYVPNKPRAMSDTSGVSLHRALWEHGRHRYLVPISAVAASPSESSEETVFPSPSTLSTPSKPALKVQSTPKAHKEVVCHRLVTEIPPGVGFF